MKILYVVRHCKAEGQAPEATLTTEGYQQVEQLKEFFSGVEIDSFYSSPYTRAYETIRPLSKQLGLEIQIDSRLSERVLSTKFMDDWYDRLRDSFEDLELSFEGGESNIQTMERAISFINDIVQGPYQKVVVATHGGLMSMLLKSLEHSFDFEDWEKLSNPDVYQIEIGEQENRIQRIWK
jgi:2,3-bisphosphoglycerate-dependent phosphoglycerate mutase